ncbi:hypothetical protein KAT24_02065 [Candidatus Pacearchaeota archaeon]|nr:hypothetical protein [Candidatus Pacearchaeota archaeon]
MPGIPLTTGSAIADYIKDVKNQIKAGLEEDASLAGPIDLEMSTTLEKGAGGGFNISVLRAGAKVKHLEVHKIKIPIKLNSEVDKIEDEARKAEAEFQKKLSDKKKEFLEKGTHPNQIKR